MKTFNDLIQSVITYATTIPENQEKPLFVLTSMANYLEHSIGNYFHPGGAPKDCNDDIVKHFYKIGMKGFEIADCYNCDAPVLDCKCGDTSTVSQEGIICPHCGFLHLTDNSEKIDVENTCKSCDRVFKSDYNTPYGEKFWMAYV
jgi:hypothetical protein